jgi:hypothetical protein
MGAPTSEVGYTSATTRRGGGTTKSIGDMWWYWEKIQTYATLRKKNKRKTEIIKFLKSAPNFSLRNKGRRRILLGDNAGGGGDQLQPIGFQCSTWGRNYGVSHGMSVGDISPSGDNVEQRYNFSSLKVALNLIKLNIRNNTRIMYTSYLASTFVKCCMPNDSKYVTYTAVCNIQSKLNQTGE